MRRPVPAARVVAALLATVALTAGGAHAQPRFAPQIDDPMLAPAPAASTELASWAEAQRLIAGHATNVLRADAGVAAAEARAGIARSALMPTARATAAVTLDILHPGTAPGIPATADYEPTSPLGTASVTARQPVLDVAARRTRDAAGADRRGAQWTRIDAERRSAHDVALAIISVAAAGRAAELNRVGLRQALERAALGERTFQLGAATELDVVRTQQDVALARAALVAGDEQLRTTRENLALALGVDGDVGVTAALAGDALLGELAGQCRPLRGDEARADVAAADADVEAARARRAAAKAGYLPTLDLTTALSAYTTDPAPARIPSWTVALVLEVPLWEGGLRKSAIAAGDAAERDAAAVRAGIQRAAQVEMSRARRGGEVASALVTTATEARTLAEKIDTMTRRSFEIGRATSLELVQSAAALRQAELTLSLRQYEQLAAQVDALLTEARCVP